MKNSTPHTKGFTLVASLLMLLLLSGIAIGLLTMVNTEGKVGGTDLQNNMAYRAAEGGIEKMASDLNKVFQNIAAPVPSQICAVGSTSNQPAMTGVTWKDYSVQPGTAQNSTCPSTMSATWGTITGSGQNAGLEADIIPVNMLVTAALPGGQEVSMTRQAQVALIPAFQFGVFSDGDLLFNNGSTVDVAGPVHTNADLYPCSSNGILTFHDRVSAWGNVVRTQQPNGVAMNPGCITPVYIPTADGDCAWGGGASSTCINMVAPSTTSPYGDGSVTGAGSATAQTGSTYIPNSTSDTWSTFSKTTVNLELVNGNYGSVAARTTGTGAKKLSLAFVGGGSQPYEIIRRPPTGEDTTSSVSLAREYNMAQIRVLLSDDPTEFQNGTGWSDSQNVRLANITTAQATAQGGNAVQTNPFGIAIASGNYGSAFGSPGGTNTFNLYFAAASNAVPVPSACSASSKTCPTADWPYAPKQWTANGSPSLQGLQPAGMAPVFLNNGSSLTSSSPTVPTINLCPPASVASVPTGCPSTPTYPYYALPNPSTPVVASALTRYNSQYANAWSLIDGYLRVEYKDSSGVWHPVTNEWLSLGFARGSAAPTAPGPSGTGSNPINPNAILLLQEPADRLLAGTAANTTAGLTAYGVPITFPATGTTAPSACALYTGTSCTTAVSAPACTTWNVGHTICTAWTAGVPPILAADDGTSGHEWAFGITPSSTSTTTPQSLTQYNWYPINFYDAREGEAREQTWTGGITAPSTDTTCTTNGMMNAVEIDVGNLKRWLAGSIGTSGTSVDYAAQNGYVLYFSDRRGMLINPNATSTQIANTKSGDSGLEDVVNSSSQVGAPDGVLDPIPANRSYSPEDFNLNGVLDNYGSNNLGLGFWGTGNSATQNLNTLINSGTHDDPYGTGGTGTAGYTSNRIASCGTTGRKNWVSGARHVLKLVDGAYGNVPRRPSALVVTNSDGSTTNYWGGFTVAAENPVYVQGDYNSSATEEASWVNPPSTPTDLSLHSAAAIITDSLTLLSDYWDDRRSTMGKNDNSSPTTIWNRLPSANTYYRMGIVSGKSTNFTSPSWVSSSIGDVGVDGGVGNFMRLLENWGYNPSGSGNDTLNYYGSMVSLFYQNYNTGIFKCGGNCQEVYYFGNRHFIFDTDFNSPYSLPPGTPMFHDVETLSYRQLFTTRTN